MKGLIRKDEAQTTEVQETTTQSTEVTTNETMEIVQLNNSFVGSALMDRIKINDFVDKNFQKPDPREMETSLPEKT